MKKLTVGLVVFCLMGVVGCAAVHPGGEVAKGLGQYKEYSWNEQGAFTVKGHGPQEERFTLMAGDIVTRVGEDGQPVPDYEKSTVDYYLSADPSADEAGNAMTHAFKASTEQMKLMNATVQNLTNLLVGVALRGQAVPGTIEQQKPPDVSEATKQAIRDGIIEVLKEQQRRRGNQTKVETEGEVILEIDQ